MEESHSVLHNRMGYGLHAVQVRATAENELARAYECCYNIIHSHDIAAGRDGRVRHRGCGDGLAGGVCLRTA